MKNFIFVFVFMITSIGFSQNSPVDFEAGGFGADWTWTVFENDTNPPLEIIANPDASGINTSATVAKFTALQAGAPFAGCETMHGADIGTFDLTTENAVVKIMVWKPVISDVGIKFATPPGGSFGEIKVPNTLVNQWEELTFDFTPWIDHPKANNIDQLIVFPDFNARTSDNIIYFDNITFGDQVLGLSGTKAVTVQSFPNPVTDDWHISSTEAISSIRIMNIAGESLITLHPESTDQTIDLSSLTAGMYFASVATLQGLKTIKLIKN